MIQSRFFIPLRIPGPTPPPPLVSPPPPHPSDVVLVQLGLARCVPHFPRPPTLSGTPPLPCAESGNLCSGFLLNFEGCMAMVMAAATFHGTDDENDDDNDMLSMMSNMILLSTRVAF